MSYASAAASFRPRVEWHLGPYDAHSVVIELQPDSVLPLRNPRGLTVLCREGVVWITQDDDPNDIVLEAGEGYRLTRNRTALLMALRSARIALEPST